MKYQYIKQAKVSHQQIADALGYKNVQTFRRSSAHKRIMQGLDQLFGKLLQQIER